MDERDRTLAPDRAFVVRFRAGADPTRNDVAGLIEHVSSGRGIRFSSYDEMLAFMRRELTAPRAAADE